MRAIDARHNQVRTVPLRDSLRYGWGTIPIILAYVFVVWSTFLWFEPPPITSYYRFASTSTVRPGDSVTIFASVIRSRAGCESTVTRVWHDDAHKIIASVQFPMPALPAGLETYEQPATVPSLMPPGSVWLKTVVEFRCNVIQRALGGVKFVMPDLKFTVVHG